MKTAAFLAFWIMLLSLMTLANHLRHPAPEPWRAPHVTDNLRERRVLECWPRMMTPFGLINSFNLHLNAWQRALADSAAAGRLDPDDWYLLGIESKIPRDKVHCLLRLLRVDA
jgi:hypothetical protein